MYHLVLQCDIGSITTKQNVKKNQVARMYSNESWVKGEGEPNVDRFHNKQNNHAQITNSKPLEMCCPFFCTFDKKKKKLFCNNDCIEIER